jgi:hypothetical protein
MLLIIQPQTPHSLHILQRKRCKQQPYISYLIRNIMLPEYFSTYDLCLFCFRDVYYAMGQDRIAVIGSAVFGQEADESLQ